jgi:dTDP-3-amino-3,4,6-trideoxy-alpha-D-glucose transaminase
MDPIVRLNDLSAQWRAIRSAVLDAVETVGASGHLILGEKVSQFEQTLASYAGVKHVVGCASGLDAIEISLRVLGLQRGDQVLTTPLSAFATTLAIVRAGGIPVFVDVDNTGLLDLEAAEEILLNKNEPIRFLLPVHLFGHAIELKRLADLKQRFGFNLVEDCAQAIGATSDRIPVGTISEMSATSFYPTKNLGCMGDGGAIFTADEGLAAAAKALRDYGQASKYVHAYLGMNSRLDEIQAAILLEALLPRLSAFTQRRREIANLYREKIISNALTLPPVPTGSASVYHLFPILVNNQRDRFREHLKTYGIESAVHYPFIIPEQPALQGAKFEVPNAMTNASRFAKREVSLPIHPFLTNNAVERVIDACNRWEIR